MGAVTPNDRKFDAQEAPKSATKREPMRMFLK